MLLLGVQCPRLEIANGTHEGAHADVHVYESCHRAVQRLKQYRHRGRVATRLSGRRHSCRFRGGAAGRKHHEVTGTVVGEGVLCICPCIGLFASSSSRLDAIARPCALSFRGSA